MRTSLERNLEKTGKVFANIIFLRDKLACAQTFDTPE